MLDLWLALIVMTLVALGLFLITYLLCRKLELWVKRAWASFIVALIVGYSIWFLDSRLILTILPFQAALVYGNFLIPLSSILAAVLWRIPNKPLWRRLLFSLPIVFVAYGYNFAQIMVQIPPCGDKWDRGVCLQTRQSSCVPAACATLLYYHGIDATEKEMAQWCLTSERGTYLHGLYRGLKEKTNGLPILVRVGEASEAELRRKNSLPVLLYVKLTKEVDRFDKRFARDWGWIVGVDHVVVLFRFTRDGRVVIGDPGAGREIWELQTLRDLWQGQYVCLIRETN